MQATLSNYRPTDKALWKGRKDSLPSEYFFQNVQIKDISQEVLETKDLGLALLGFCCDEGIRRNEGRVGAQLGPLVFREFLAKLAYHDKRQIVDIGNIVCEKDELEIAQAQFAELIHFCQQQGYKTIAIGGGHEIAFGHFCGLTAKYPKLGIINFDAHFDLRPVKKEGLATSGTPFYQIAKHCHQYQLDFSYCCLGIQNIANSPSLFKRAEEWNVDYLFAKQMYEQSLAQQTAFLDEFLNQQEHIYLSICLDVFAEAYAPGVSAPQAMGLSPAQVMPLLKYILQTGKVVSIDIAELSPPLDQGVKTTRLAASLLAEILHYY